MVDTNQVTFKRKITPIGGSYGITIPKELFLFLGLKNTSDVAMSGYTGKHGRYVAFWMDENKMSRWDIMNEVKKDLDKKDGEINEEKELC